MRALLLVLALFLTRCDCGGDTRRYTLCAGGPILDPKDAPVGAVEVWIGDGDITCWEGGSPTIFRTMSSTETPESACEFCEGLQP